MTDAGSVANFSCNNASFKFKQKIIGSTGNDGPKTVQIIVALKYLSNFWKTLEIPLNNCKINVIPTWYLNCVKSSAAANQHTTFAITDTKISVPMVTLATLSR